MADQLSLQITNSLTAVQAANQTVSRWLADAGAPAAIQYFARLAIEEFGTNVIKFGYDDANQHLIQVNLSLSSSELVLTIIGESNASPWSDHCATAASALKPVHTAR